MATQIITPIFCDDQIRVEKKSGGLANGYTREWAIYIVHGRMQTLIDAGLCDLSLFPEGNKRTKGTFFRDDPERRDSFCTTKKRNGYFELVIREPKEALANKLELLLNKNQKTRGHLRLVWSAPV
ncbi:hypothetical protein [Polaromonas eurypsychrophila]|uniref:Uncharacterized protein n=1 Tax=Polaromonas eurypsychrophila TaxID=1614635 RepID=A0A916SMG1_9BURK|nr:hypothetical protein [Polaromonas eurypsychrophila]GGB03617.1 hypothetical protein GCM10011496_25720 [Polaromonas eurypsychrophila]